MFTQELESSVEISNITTTVDGASVTGIGGSTATFTYTPQSAGTVTGNIVITGTNEATATIPVTLTVTSPSPQQFTISPDTLNEVVDEYNDITTQFTASENIASATFNYTTEPPEPQPSVNVSYIENVITLSINVGYDDFSGEISVVSVNSNTATIPIQIGVRPI